MDIKVLITKIEKLQEYIDNQANISQLDVDLQLSHIRALYDAYLEIKYNFADTQPYVAETTTVPPMPECDDCEESSLFEESEEVDEIEDEESVEEIEEDEDIAEEEPEDEEIVEEFEEEIQVLENEEDEFPIVEMDARMPFLVPDISTERETSSVSDINLDDIEFDEDSDEDEVAEKKPQTSFPLGMPQSRYYGDEIEVENPIPVKSTIGDSYKAERPSLNEIVSSYKHDESIGSKLQQGGVSDLMKSIDMNNKFLFVRELFKSNGSLFTEEINKLNSFNKLNEAIPYLDTIKAKYKWDAQSEAYTELYRLVLRKFVK